LRTSQAILAEGGVVWITPQGRFADARETVQFKPGLGALAGRVSGVTLLPLAIEYTFWDERLPEVLLRFGAPVKIQEENAEAATKQLENALVAVMGELKSAAMARDPGAFHVLLQGGRGTGGFYALGRSMRAFVTGKRLAADHTKRDSRGSDVEA
jgi:hypothetical protein